MRPMSRLDWRAAETRLEKCRCSAEELVEAMKLSVPIDPLAIATAESPMLKFRGGDFRERFDGQLEYHPHRRRFVMLFNTKYDAGLPVGQHHPRTRFSIGHELGHYFLDRHRAYFLSGGKPHASRGEFVVDVALEREADAFAAALLLPSKLVRPLVNQDDLSLAAIEDIARRFGTSLVSTAIRAVQLSDFPCAVVGLHGDAVSWSSCSRALIEAGIYPPARGASCSVRAREVWASFKAGVAAKASDSSVVGHWFRTFGRDGLNDIPVREYYLPVPSMRTLVVLLTVSERDVLHDDVDDESDDS